MSGSVSRTNFSTQEIPPIVFDDERLEELRATRILEEEIIENFDRLTDMAVRRVGADGGFVAFLREDGQFLRGCVGLPEPLSSLRETPIDHSVCAHTLGRTEPLAITNLEDHPELGGHPAFEEYGIVAYLGFPLRSSQGHVVGTFCLVGWEPREWTEADISAARVYADLAQTEIELRLELRSRERLEEKLEEKVFERTQELQAAKQSAEEARRDVVYRLARAAEHRDNETGEHIQRVGKTCRLLAKALGRPSEWQDRIEEAAVLHDIGKIGIPDRILLKAGPLTDEEYQEIKEHTLIGADMLAEGKSPLMQMAERIARSHHERWDGNGYPDGLEGDDIPLAARIVSVADTLDAMTNDRPYRNALPVETALEVIEEEAGHQFDPQVAEAALQNRETLRQLWHDAD